MAEFNAKQQLPGLLDWMRAQMKACGGKTAVIGISGGKDSSVTAALSVAAYGRENVVGVLMPDGVQPDIDYSNGLVDVLNIRHYTFNIHGGTSGILDEMARVGIDASRQTKVNLPSRIRMATLYAIAQSEEGGIVKREAAIAACKVQVVCPKCNKGTRVAHKIEGGKKIRVCKHCGAEL